MNVIFTIGIFISLFQFILLLNKKPKSLPDKLLAAWMLIISIHLLSSNFYHLGYWDLFPHLVGITAPFPFLYGPLLFLYVSHSLKNDNRLNNQDFLHFSPFALSYLYLARFYFFYSAEEKRLVDSGEVNDFQMFAMIMLVGFVISGIAYSILSFKQITQHTSLIENNFSHTDRMNLNWLKGLIWGVGILFLVVAIRVITGDLMGVDYRFNTDYIIYSIIVSGVLMLGYFGIRHQNIFTDNIVVKVAPKESYYKSSLKNDEAKQKHTELLHIMAMEKPYLQPKLSLATLADLLNTSPNHLSQIINQFEQKNFNDFVNQYRVEEFIQLTADKDHHSFLALALEAGFNSKSTFNKLFKKYKGLTPSQFLTQERPQ